MRYSLRPLATLVSLLAGITTVSVFPGSAAAHWCSNIFRSPSRIVVRPATDTVYIPSDGSVSLRVYVRNNFPYRLRRFLIRGEASDYTVSVVSTNAPEDTSTSSTADVAILPNQTVFFVLSISPDGGATGDVSVTNLNLQVDFRFGDWQSTDDCFITESPSQDLVSSSMTYGATAICPDNNSTQASSLAAATWADKFPETPVNAAGNSPFFDRTGIQMLINWFGYRFCYNTSGGYRSGSTKCPEDADPGSAWDAISQFAQHCMRAGTELGARRDALSATDAATAQQAALDALAQGGSDQHKCIAALVGAYLWQNQSSTSAFTSALSNASNAIPSGCQDAGWRIIDGSHASSCSSGAYYEQAVCAAAEGIRGNNTPVTEILMQRAGDGQASAENNSIVQSPYDYGYESLYYAYVLSLVAADREATSGIIDFYPSNINCDEISTCTDDDGCCPSGCNASTTDENGDNDCTPECDNNVIEPGETCDPISSCNTIVSNCDDGDSCTTEYLSGTPSECTSVCNTGTTITRCMSNDGCCLAICNNNNDNDCSPECNNGVVEPGGDETCDPISSCPETASDCADENACTIDAVTGSAATCTSVCDNSEHIETCDGSDGDGCCPSGCNSATDDDCSATCDDSNIDEGETCDPPSSCPTECAQDQDPCTVNELFGSADNCNAECVARIITQCIASDGCCPASCNALSDNDCNPICDNGVLEGNETCEPRDQCPTTADDCNDGIPCTSDLYSGSADDCTATCDNPTINTCVHGDGCCPPTCTYDVDNDCTPPTIEEPEPDAGVRPINYDGGTVTDNDAGPAGDGSIVSDALKGDPNKLAGGCAFTPSQPPTPTTWLFIGLLIIVFSAVRRKRQMRR